MSITYRHIEPQDNAEIAEVIRKIFREHRIDRPGTVYTDPTTDRLYELFRTPKSVYWIALDDGVMLALRTLGQSRASLP